MVKVAIVDYGVGNLRSIGNGLKKAGAESFVTSRADELRNVDAVVLPGVGAFGEAIKHLTPLYEALQALVNGGRSLLGICLGMQLLFTASTEGGFHKGLNYFNGLIVKLPPTVKIPHIGWNTLEIRDPDCVLLDGIPSGSFVYFVHSYYVRVNDEAIVDAETTYGVRFPSVISKGSIFATQFHPEKSGRTGLKMLKNFIRHTRR